MYKEGAERSMQAVALRLIADNSFQLSPSLVAAMLSRSLASSFFIQAVLLVRASGFH